MIKLMCALVPRSLCRSSWFAAIIVLFICSEALVPCSSSAQSRRARLLLHERLPRAARAARSDKVVRSKAGQIAAIETSGGQIAKPRTRPKRAAQAPLYEAQGRDQRIRADNKTGAEGTLHYKAVFNPTVTPFKRDKSFDKVTATGELVQSGAGLRPIRPSQSVEKSGFELFWGHITVELRPGLRTPIPSVAPDGELVSVDTVPPRALTMYRDTAGNFYATAKRGGSVSLRYLMSAPSAYFGAPIGTGPVRDDPMTPRLDAVLQRRMRRLWPVVGVGPGKSRKHNVEMLAEHFRSFSAGQLDGAPGADLLTDLIVAQRGVCRHRAHAFVVMAHSLGIPAHYVINDAHAFVEVWVPGKQGRGRWQRVDLGGGAETLRLHGADQRHLHDPLFRDPLPRPDAYQQGVTGLVADGRLNDSSWAGAAKVVGANGLVGRGGGSRPDVGRVAAVTEQENGAAPVAHNRSNGATATTATRWLRERAAERATIARNVAAPSLPPLATPKQRRAASPQQVSTVLRLQGVEPVAYVGEMLKLSGSLTRADGRPIAKMPVEIWLVEPNNPTAGTRLGEALTDGSGRFLTHVAVPMSAQLGEHDVVVYFPGRGKLAPAFSRD